MEKQAYITRKIQIFVDCDDKEQRAAYYQTLFDWRDMVYQGANLVTTHLFVQDNIKELIYLKEDVRVKLADYTKDPAGILTSSKMFSTYRILSLHFKGLVPADILSVLNMNLTKWYNAERLGYVQGKRSLRNFKQNTAIPFSGKQLKLLSEEPKRDFRFSLFKVPFRTYLGKDYTDKPRVLRSVLAGQLKVCSSSLKILQGKLFLFLTVAMPKLNYALKAHQIAEVSLSVEHPLQVQINHQHYQIGNKAEFLHRRLAIQAARQRNLKAATFNKNGKGRKKKMSCVDRYQQMEKRYVVDRLHVYSKKLIDICVFHQVGTIVFVNQTQKEIIAKADSFLLRNWSYFDLIAKIRYKANLAGISIIVE